MKYSYLLLMLCYISVTAQIDSLGQVLTTASKEEKIEIYKEIIQKYSNTQVEKTISYLEEGLNLFEGTYTKDSGLFFLTLGRLHNAQAMHEKALYYNKKALEVSKKMEYDLGVGKCYQNIGVTHLRMGQYNLTLDYYLKALDIYKAQDRQNYISGLYGNIGSLYSCRLEDHTKGLLYYNKALFLSEESENQTFRAHILGAVSELYMRQEKYVLAKKTIEESMAIAKNIDAPTIAISGFSNLSQINIAQKNFKKALFFANKSLDLRLKTGNLGDTTQDYIRLASIYEKLNNSTASLTKYKKALEIAVKSKLIPERLKIYEALHKYYIRQGDFKNGYDNLIKYNSAKDSLFNEKKDRQLKEIQTKYDLESKEKQLQLLTNANQIKELENKNQKSRQLFMVIGLGILALLGIGVFIGYLRKKKSNTILELKNEEITQALKDREILLKEVHHRVKNNLQIVASLLRLQHKFSDRKGPKEILQQSQDKIQAMVIIHEKLYTSNNLSSINLQTYLDELITYFKTSYPLSENNILIKTSIENIDLDMDHLVPCGLILNEVITNSIKHAFKDKTNGSIEISAKEIGKNCVLTISDNGIGFSKDFKIEQSTSLGIQLIQGLANQIKATLTINSNIGTSYSLTFKLPF